MSKRNGLGSRGTVSSIEHSEPGSDKHLDDVKNNPLKAFHIRVSANEMRTYGNTPSHPNVEKGELKHDHSVQGYLPGRGVVSTEECKQGLYAARDKFAGLKVRTGSMDKHRPSLDRRGGGSRHMDETDCLQKQTITFHPAVSEWWKNASIEKRNSFLEKSFPEIAKWSESRFEGGKCAGIQLHDDTAHLHVDIWMECGKIKDFGGKTGKAVMYDSKVMTSRGVGPGICHLGRKQRLFKMAGEELSNAESTKLELGLAQGKKTGRLHDIKWLGQFEVIHDSIIGMDELKPYVKSYVAGEKKNNPFQQIDEVKQLIESSNDLKTQNTKLEKQVAELQEILEERQTVITKQVRRINHNETIIGKQFAAFENNKSLINKQVETLSYKKQEMTDLVDLYNEKSKEFSKMNTFYETLSDKNKALLFLGYVAENNAKLDKKVVKFKEKALEKLDDSLFLKYRRLPESIVPIVKKELDFILGLKKRPKIQPIDKGGLDR